MKTLSLDRFKTSAARAFSGLAAALVLSVGVSGTTLAASHVYGTTWFSDGTRNKVGPSGSQVSAYAVGAVPGMAYQLVSGKNGCSTDIVPINTAVVYAGSNGLIGKVTGTINRQGGTYDVCFYSVSAGSEGATVTAPLTFVVAQ